MVIITRRHAIAAAAAALLLPGCGKPVPDTVRIGMAVSLSGPTGTRGQDLLNGALLAAEELNAAGFKINGKVVRIEIVPKDDKADKELVPKIAQEVVDEGLHAVIGHINTPETQLAAPIYASKMLPHMTTSTNAKLLGAGNGNMLRLVAHDGVQARALATYATESLGGRKLAALVETTAYGKDMYADMVAALKAKKLPEPLRLDVEFKEPVGDAIAAKLKEAEIDVVVVIAREVHGISLMQKLAAVGHTNIQALGVNPIRTTKMAQTPIPIRGFYATATTIDAGEEAAGREFLGRFRARFKSDPVWGAPYAYDAVNALVGAMATVGSVDPAQVLPQLKRNNLRTKVLHQMAFAEDGEQRYPSIGVYKIESGRWAPVMRSDVW